MGPKKNAIHKSPEEKLADSSQSSVDILREHSTKLDEVNQSVKDLHEIARDKTTEAMGFNEINDNLIELKGIVNQDKVIRKLDEVKSASLISNKFLKDISKKDIKFPEQKEFPKEMEVSIKGISLIQIKGDKGDKGDRGDKGDFIQGEQGLRGEKGDKGSDGKVGKTGKEGKNGSNGSDGKDGKDGSPDTSDEVVEKINSATKKIDPKQVKGLKEVMNEVERYGTNPVGQGVKEAGGGGNVTRFLVSGSVLSSYVTELNFSTGITATYDGNGRITLTASGGGGFTELTTTETPDGSTTVFTFSGASAQPSYIVSDNVWMKATTKAGTVNWTWSAGAKQATLTIPPVDDIYAIV